METYNGNKRRRTRALRVLAVLTIVGVADYLLIVAALHFLRPDVNVVVEAISNYGVGPYSSLLIAAVLGSAVAALALTLGLYLGMVPPARSYVGLFFLGLYGVSRLLESLFPIDVGTEATLVGTIHNILGQLAFFGFPLAVILLSLSMGKDEQWRSFRRPALVVSFAVVLTDVLTIVGSNIGLFGVTQRLATVTAMLWMLLVGLRLRPMTQRAFAQQASRVS
jgi:hypothetical protein